MTSFLSRKNHPAASMEERPLTLKKLMLDTGIVQPSIARTIPCSRSSINLTVNRGYIPHKIPNYVENVEAYVSNSPAAMAWLKKEGLEVADIWTPLEGGNSLSHKLPAGTVGKIRKSRINKAMVPGNPEQIISSVEVEMVHGETLKHFKLFRNPFTDDIQTDSDIYMSEEHNYLFASMLDAAQYSGFLAVSGEVGCGKSIIRRKLIKTLKRDDNMLVIYPQIIDKERVTASSLCDAIILDISDERPKMKLEQKTRQVLSLLLNRAQNGHRACLIIEEAQDLNPKVFKQLKRFYELEDGYKKLLGIILIGQTELKYMFDESTHIDMREVIRRCQMAEIKGLNGGLKDYLKKKFGRLKVELDSIIDDAGITALSERLTVTDRGGKKISSAFPLSVNNHMAKAMNLACTLGEEKVTAEIIMEV